MIGVWRRSIDITIFIIIISEMKCGSDNFVNAHVQSKVQLFNVRVLPKELTKNLDCACRLCQ